MKKHFYNFGLALFSALLIIGCVEKDEISQWNSLYDLREQNVELKDMCYKINNNINSIQKLLEAQKDNLGIKSVTNVADGYIIVFSDDSFITLLNGKDGADGKDGKDGVNGKDGINGVDGKDATAYIPSISVKLSDGVYYWTLDGEFLTDDEGNKICAQGLNGRDGVNGKDGKDAVVPQLKVEDDNWLISYDDGNTWKTIGSASGANGKDGVDGKDGKDGITPQIKIEDGKYLVSYDNGDSWTSIGGSLNNEDLEINAPVSGYVDGYAYVDLGLPSGTLWAVHNIGAENVYDYGKYFWWGDTIGYGRYEGFDFDTNNPLNDTQGKSSNKLKSSGIIDDNNYLVPSRDAAYVQWGENWKMPTKEDFRELNKECIWTQISYCTIRGFKVESKTNNNWIFIPASGQGFKDRFEKIGYSAFFYYNEASDEKTYTFRAVDDGTGAELKSETYVTRYQGNVIRPVVKKK